MVYQRVFIRAGLRRDTQKGEQSLPRTKRQGYMASSLSTSFDIYYRDHARVARMDALHRQLVAPGALVFDIGAHVGDRTGSFLRLRASVVALEPQPRVFRALRLLYGACERATLIQSAAGDAVGELPLHLNTQNPTVATVAPAFINASQGAPGWEGQNWDSRVLVPVTTLDALIARHGRPNFVKIDVEGHEQAVLTGLNTALPLLSFEFTMIQLKMAHACLDRLDALGHYEFNISFGEEHALQYDSWLSKDAMSAALDAAPEAANSGDVYARLA